jgi:hypothetical protein
MFSQGGGVGEIGGGGEGGGAAQKSTCVHRIKSLGQV